MLIDAHMHLADFRKFRSWVNDMVREAVGPDYLAYLDRFYSDPAYFVQFLQENGIGYAVLMAEECPAVSGECSPEELLSKAAGHPELLPFASLNPYVTPEPAAQLARYIKMGCRGLKLYPSYQYFYPNDRQLYPIYAQAEELGIPVTMHLGSSIFRGARLKYADPLFLDDVAVDFPDLVLIMAHGGRGFWYDRAFFLAQLHQNVYLEVSGLPPQRLLDYYPSLEKIADKVIYGSDWPSVSPYRPRSNIEALLALPLTMESKEKILGKNAARILGITGQG